MCCALQYNTGNGRGDISETSYRPHLAEAHSQQYYETEREAEPHVKEDEAALLQSMLSRLRDMEVSL